jgi:prepilin-type processing-associated H-X9-DG protein
MDLANYDAVMGTYPGFPATGHRYSRTDYFPFTGYDERMLTTARCGNALNSPLSNTRNDLGAMGPKGIGPNGGQAITSITDGTSNTLFYTEIAGRGVNVYVRGRSVAAAPSNIAQYGAISPTPVLPTNGAGDPSQFVRGTWADQNGVSFLRGYANVATGQVNVDQGCQVINVANHGAPYSMHSGGVNVLRCDGSVSFLRDSVTGNVVIAMVTRAGGEVYTEN